VNKGEDMNNEHFKELKNINQSLTTLGKVIASLSSKVKSVAAFR
jgi:Kinesin motor domain